jgi:hypothetical protein
MIHSQRRDGSTLLPIRRCNGEGNSPNQDQSTLRQVRSALTLHILIVGTNREEPLVSAGVFNAFRWTRPFLDRAFIMKMFR